MLNFSDFNQVYMSTTNHHLNGELLETLVLSDINNLTHISRMDSSILIIQKSSYFILGVSG